MKVYIKFLLSTSVNVFVDSDFVCPLFIKATLKQHDTRNTISLIQCDVIRGFVQLIF